MLSAANHEQHSIAIDIGTLLASKHEKETSIIGDIINPKMRALNYRMWFFVQCVHICANHAIVP
jgi:hypothetical protein